MTQRFFLGANSQEGFASLYDGFPGEPGSFLHVIKGGPGTGKSSFMRKLGAEAEARGLDVQYVLCSGDPDSLDGVYIPALHAAWVDGTAPHVREPACFGAEGDYISLGAFCTKPFSAEEREILRLLSEQYKEHYRLAYASLSALGRLQAELYLPLRGEERLAAQRQVSRILDRFLPREAVQKGRCIRRFYHALSCQGELWLSAEIQKMSRQFCRIEGSPREAAGLLAFAAGEAVRRGAFSICCPSPLSPDLLEAILLPEEGLVLAAGGWEINAHLSMDENSFRSAEGRQAAWEMENRRKTLSAPLLGHALDELRCAKALHDQLEQVYKPHMDFTALSAYTDETIHALFP
ncbi:MAG: hypothetical protein J5927_06140 [Oscillospiraceae bacterium]|nr:hypothetical protein [Oscillospiraceae bacterium]